MQMGAGIAQVAATKGLDVILCDSSQASLERGLGRISDSLSRLVKKGTVTQQEADEAYKRVKTTEELDVRQSFSPAFCP
jgi:3-hydroxybutyryl-CoA dehydrogenase